MALFGSSGVRGIANEEITPQLALDFGLTIGSIYPEIVVGHDPRISSEMIEHAIVAGLLSAGSKVVKVGMVPTPTLAIASQKYGCGIMITASHNPAKYVGMKFFKCGISFNTQQQEEIEYILREKKFRYAKWEKTGDLNIIYDALKAHHELIMKNTARSNLKIVLDCGSGAASVITPYVLMDMGCEVIPINSQPDGHFPSRDPEPIDRNLGLLKATVRACNADIGIAHDGDADRMMAVDNLGRFIDGDKMLALFATREAKTAIAVPLDTSAVIDDILNKIDKKIKISRTRVGDMYIAEELNKIGGEFGGEPSGAWIFPRISMCPDGIYAAARLVEIVEKEGKLSKLIESIPEYPIKRGKIQCSNKQNAMAKIVGDINKLGDLEPGKISMLDGIRADFDEGWVLIRPSGTEPIIRITAESANMCDDLYEKSYEIVRKACENN
jgi:phosphoglucosamine mutase